ncbi:MAG: ThuA domain-containing protein [Acidobacteriota bacterium]
MSDQPQRPRDAEITRRGFFSARLRRLCVSRSGTPSGFRRPPTARCLQFLLLASIAVAIVSPQSLSRTAAKRKILYITHSAGFKHAVLPLSEQILKEIGERSGMFEVTATQDLSLITTEGLKPFAAVVFYTTGELLITDEQKVALLDFIKSGKAFLGIHSATDTFYKWAEYGEMIGGYFDQHPWHQEVTVKVEDQKHPATKHLDESFKITDEIYQFKNWDRSKVHVLLSLDATSVDLTKPAVHRTDKDFALAWCRDYGRGRVFYTALGHRPEVWQDERFQQLLIGAMRWATRV